MFRVSPGSLGCLRKSRGSSQSTRNDVLFVGQQRWIWKYTGLLSKPSGLKKLIMLLFPFDTSLKQKSAGFYRIFNIFNWLVLTQKWNNLIFVLVSLSFMVRHNFKIFNSKIGESRGRWNTLVYPVFAWRCSSHCVLAGLGVVLSMVYAALRNFSVANFDVGNFATGNFAVRTFRR